LSPHFSRQPASPPIPLVPPNPVNSLRKVRTKRTMRTKLFWFPATAGRMAWKSFVSRRRSKFQCIKLAGLHLPAAIANFYEKCIFGAHYAH
jgi:hypothetical protein